MNDNARKWVAALRSGEYKQTGNTLKDVYGYCCLGVACDLFQKEVGSLIIQENDGRTYFNGSSTNLPGVVKDWLGLRTSTGSMKERSISLTHLNDEYRYTFPQIADVIESEPPGLFAETAA